MTDETIMPVGEETTEETIETPATEAPAEEAAQ